MLKLSVVGLIVSGALLAGSANAHARLQSSQPADKAQLTQAPNSLTLNFNEAAQLAVLKLILDSKEIVIPVDKTAKASQSFTLSLPPLAPGKYTVQWTAIAADDGHITKGSFAFSITA
jgi:methionine-rich copper-binding protein CopC